MPRVLALALLAAAAGAPPAAAGVAPGRAWWDVGTPAPERTVDAAGATAVAALPDGGAVLAVPDGQGAVVLRTDRAGRRTGQGRIAVGPTGYVRFSPRQVLADPAGRIVLVGEATARAPRELPRFVLARLTPDLRPDATFGGDGAVVVDGVQLGCACPRTAALQPDGRIVLAASRGRAASAPPPAEGRFELVVARLTEGGALDPSFGDGGVVGFPETVGADAGGNAVEVLPDGRIVVLGRGPGAPVLARLLPGGTRDGSFGGGRPVAVPLAYAFGLAVAPDGRAVAFGARERTSPSARLVRFGEDGAVAGTTDLEGAPAFAFLAGRPDGRLLVADDELRTWSVAPDGAVATAALDPGFGGGTGTTFARLRPRPVDDVRQGGFLPGGIALRPDGSLVVAGGVRLVRYAGEGVGVSSARPAVASFTADLRRDEAYGGPATAPRAAVRVPHRSLAFARRAKRVLVVVGTTTPALARVTVRAEGGVIADVLEPLHAAGRTPVRVRLTARGERLLRTRRRALGVTAEVVVRDLVTQEVVSAGSGTLR